MTEKTSKLRIVKVIDEFQLLTCIKEALWGSNTARFADWKPGDVLVITVDRALAAMGRVSGAPFTGKNRVWDNGAYPHRIPIHFEVVIPRPKRPLILGPVRDALIADHGTTYGYCLLNQQPVSSKVAETVLAAINGADNQIKTITSNIDQFMADAAAKRATANKKVAPAVIPSEDDTPEVPADSAETSNHLEAQHALARLGRITGSSIWIATIDKNKLHKGKPVSEGCLKELPNLGLNPDATKRISLIDVLWLKDGAPISAFEIETSTSVYSGLLRMSDLLVVVPALKLDLYIVAPKTRIAKFNKELSRPTFEKIGLSDYCRFIAIEDLDSLLKKVVDLEGCVTPTVLDKIAYSTSDDTGE